MSWFASSFRLVGRYKYVWRESDGEKELRKCVVTISASCQHPAVLTVSTQTKQNLQKDTQIEAGSSLSSVQQYGSSLFEKANR